MTELIWDGKYDKDGRKRAPVRVALPFQTIETVNESAADRQRTLNLFADGAAPQWRNRLIWGDKRYVLPALLPELAGQVNLIYIDPPFDTGADFSFTTTVPESGESFTKEPSVIEQKAYRDTWGRGLDSYLQWFYETVVLLHELLHETGSIYVHLDYRLSHYAKAVLDEVFGSDQFLNQLVWRRTGSNTAPSRYGNNCDFVLFYAKSSRYVWNQLFGEYDPEYIESHYTQKDTDGRLYQLVSTTGAGATPNDYEWRGLRPPSGRHWAYAKTKMEELERTGRLVHSKSGMPRVKYYLDEQGGPPLQCLWTDIKAVNSQALERINYPTQKPETLLERILKASSNEGDLVLDCFCGSGTTAAVAEKLGRRWITCDLGRFAIHTARKRLLEIAQVRPFVVQNLGKYERQAWQTGEFQEAGARQQEAGVQRAYIDFILKLYGARPLAGHAWLHGVRAGRLVHVGAVDAPVSPGDITQIAIAYRKAMGSGEDAPTSNSVDVLGWDFAFEMNEVAKQQAALANLNVRFLKIPRDVMDKRAVEQGDIKFFELAALAVDARVEADRRVTLRLTDFVIPPDDVPAEVQRAVTHWEQWIDYWAVDWDHAGDTFHNQWQTYRTRQNKTLHKQASHAYAEPGDYRIVVKVIDILGNDTTKTVKVTIS